MLSALQFPSMGHVSGFWQLQFSLFLSEFVDLLNTVLLWPNIFRWTEGVIRRLQVAGNIKRTERLTKYLPK